MDEEELVPRAVTPKPKNLAGMSLETLHDYIAELEAEIGRAREMIASKEEAQTAADSFFCK